MNTLVAHSRAVFFKGFYFRFIVTLTTQFVRLHCQREFGSILFTDCLQLCIPGSVVCLDTRGTMTQCKTCEIRTFC